MITADTLTTLTTMGPTALKQVLAHSGYKDCVFKSAKFLGITNGGQFCYSVTFDEDGSVQQGKVFVSYDAKDHVMTADF